MKFIATTGILLVLSAPAFAQLPPSNCQHYQVGGRTYTKCSTDPVPETPAPQQQAPAPAPVPVPPPPPQAQLPVPVPQDNDMQDCMRRLGSLGASPLAQQQVCSREGQRRQLAQDQRAIDQAQNQPPPSPRDLCLFYSQAFKPSVIRMYGGNARWDQSAHDICSQLPGYGE